MSLLTAVSRAGPSTQRVLLSRVALPQAPATIDTPRFKAAKAKPTAIAVGQPGYKKNKEKKIKKRKPFPLFKSLSLSQLKNPVFQSPTPALQLEPFTPTTAMKQNAVGVPLEFSPPENDPLRIFGLPRNLLVEFRLLNKPCSVVRQVTKDTLRKLNDARGHSSASHRYVLTGPSGCGKSFLMLQAIEHCMQKDWVVIYIPRGVTLVNSTTAYTYDIRTQTYVQPAFAFQTLQRMLTVNEKALAKISLVEDIVLEKRVIPKGKSLKDVIEVAIEERKRSLAPSPAILEGVMKSLEAQTDFPVLLAVDEFQALYGKTAYRDPHFSHIHSYHLSMPRLVMEYACGKRQFNNGVVLGAISASQSTNPLPLELRDALDLSSLDKRPVSVYDKRDRVLAGYAEGLQKLEVPAKLTLEEAVGVFEVWKGQGVFGSKRTFYDEQLLGKYTESGGNPRDFVWKGLLATLDV